MSGFVTLAVDTTGIDLMLRGLAGAAKVPMKTATLAESKSVLQTALNRTKMATKQVMTARTGRKYNNYAAGDIGTAVRGQYPRISIAPRAKHDWWLDRAAEGKQTFYLMNGTRRWSNERWQRYQAEEADRQADLKLAVVEALARRGLPKQSWYLLAEYLGMQLKAGPDVINATVNKKRRTDLARTLVEDLDGSFTVHFTNLSRIAYHKNGPQIVATILRGRVKYFERNLRLGVFESMEKIAKAYPNLLTINRS